MGQHIEGVDHNQLVLFPEALDEYIIEIHKNLLR